MPCWSEILKELTAAEKHGQPSGSKDTPPQVPPVKWPSTAEDTGRAPQPLPVNIRPMAPRFVQTNTLLNETR